MEKENREFKIQLTPYNEKIISLPLYKDTYLLLQLSISTFIQSPKLVQSSLCTKAIDIEVDIITLVIGAYKYSDKRSDYLNKLLIKHLKLYTLLKLIIDNSKICQENASKFGILLEQIGKLTNAWLRNDFQ